MLHCGNLSITVAKAKAEIHEQDLLSHPPFSPKSTFGDRHNKILMAKDAKANLNCPNLGYKALVQYMLLHPSIAAINLSSTTFCSILSSNKCQSQPQFGTCKPQIPHAT